MQQGRIVAKIIIQQISWIFKSQIDIQGGANLVALTRQLIP